MVSRLSGALTGGHVTPLNESLGRGSDWFTLRALVEAMHMEDFRAVSARIHGVVRDTIRLLTFACEPGTLLVASASRLTRSLDEPSGEM